MASSEAEDNLETISLEIDSNEGENKITEPVLQSIIIDNNMHGVFSVLRKADLFDSNVWAFFKGKFSSSVNSFYKPELKFFFLSEQEITDDALKAMKTEYIQKIFPKWGNQIIFEDERAAWMKNPEVSVFVL